MSHSSETPAEDESKEVLFERKVTEIIENASADTEKQFVVTEDQRFVEWRGQYFHEAAVSLDGIHSVLIVTTAHGIESHVVLGDHLIDRDKDEVREERRIFRRDFIASTAGSVATLIQWYLSSRKTPPGPQRPAKW